MGLGVTQSCSSPPAPHSPTPVKSQQRKKMEREAFDLPMEIERSPFALPSEDEIFGTEKSKQPAAVLANKTTTTGDGGGPRLKIWERNQHSTMGRSVALSSLARSSRALRSAGLAATGGVSHGNGLTGNSTLFNKTTSSGSTRRKSDSMTDFIAKKKEMLLVQMSLDTKREEIRKLEENARMKEEDLKRNEEMLEEDALRFDTFLKENDKKAHEAIKLAERETKLRADKAMEIKKMNQQIQLIQSDMNKHREALEDCLRYKEFIDRLTPQNYFDQQHALKRRRQEERRKARFLRKKEEWDRDHVGINLENRALEDPKQDGGTSNHPGGGEKAAGNNSRKKAGGGQPKDRVSLPSSQQHPPTLELEPLTSSGEEIPMYFSKPQQLLDIFQTLEEQNLYLIQISQETESTLEDMRSTFRETRKTMDSKSRNLVESINQLEAAITAEKAKANQLRKRIEDSSGDTLEQQEELLSQLHAKVRSVYERCGFDAVSNPTTLYMLSDLEARLEEYLSATAKMPKEYVVKAEKEKEKRRREKKRAEQQALHERMQEERNRKAMERSLQGPKKRTGRKVMDRIRQSRRTLRETKEELLHEDVDEIKYLT